MESQNWLAHDDILERSRYDAIARTSHVRRSASEPPSSDPPPAPSSSPPPSGPDVDKPLFGRVLGGKYEVLSVLGGGAMGAVYLARQIGLGRSVAVKVIHASLAARDDLARRFHREAKAASRLAHPGTVSVIDFGEEDDGLLYLVMEYVEGRTLEDVIEREAPLPAARIARLVDQVLSAVAAAHEQGIVHRDLKPENILVAGTRVDDDEDEIVKVCDFGIAALLDGPDGIRDSRTSALPPAGARETAVGTIMGSPAYMAPEQARGQEPDVRCDLYSLGIVLFELLTGKHPFAEAKDMLAAQKDTPAPRALAKGTSVLALLSDVAFRAMAKDPKARFASARAMRVAVRRAVLVGVAEGPDLAIDDTNVASNAAAPSPKTMLGIGAVRGSHNQLTLRMSAMPAAADERLDAPAVIERTVAFAAQPPVSAPRVGVVHVLDWTPVLQGLAVFLLCTTVGLAILFAIFEQLV